MIKIPIHISLIPDGNRRWARIRGFVSTQGHRTAGKEENMKSLLDEAKEMGIKYMSLWGFSTENWKRNENEVKIIFSIIENLVDVLIKETGKNKMRVIHYGRKDRIPKSLLEKLERLESRTKEYGDFNLILCIDYGGKDEILRAVNKIIKNGEKEIDEKKFSEYLDSKDIPEPDLIIRTGGEKRTSGFMPFQSSYAEWYFTEMYFPDFGKDELRKAVEEFGRRQRRFGGNIK